VFVSNEAGLHLLAEQLFGLRHSCSPGDPVSIRDGKANGRWDGFEVTYMAALEGCLVVATKMATIPNRVTAAR
jgi:hypothetical protein